MIMACDSACHQCEAIYTLRSLSETRVRDLLCNCNTHASTRLDLTLQSTSSPDGVTQSLHTRVKRGKHHIALSSASSTVQLNFQEGAQVPGSGRVYADEFVGVVVSHQQSYATGC